MGLSQGRSSSACRRGPVRPGRRSLRACRESPRASGCHNGRRDPTFAGYVAFYSAVVCGLISASFVLISLSFGYFLVLRGVAEPVDLAGFVLGATAVSLFYRLAGGVFGKSAELTASLACRVERPAGGDPRNPARAATFAGNQLGSLCGAVAELFEIRQPRLWRQS